ncbi:MAG: hypothetical protein ACE14L_11770 [Terriglobales bacterium]
MRTLKINISARWYTVLLFLVEVGLLAFGLWAMLDSISIGASHAGWRFMLLFVIWSLPGVAVLLFFRPKNSGTATKPFTPSKLAKDEVPLKA